MSRNTDQSPWDLKPKADRADRVSFLIAMLNEHSPNRDQIYGVEDSKMGKALTAEERDSGSTDPDVPMLRVTYEITCAPNVLNPMGSMHGGCVASLYDNFSTYAVGARDKYWADYDPKSHATEQEALQAYAPVFMQKVYPDLAVTRMLQVIYHRAVTPGRKVFLEVHLLSDSKKFATYTAKMYDERGSVYSFMTHDKVKVGPKA